MTTAGGANYTGCDCDTFPHGCCQDGETVASGPNLEGCNCNSTYGCCSDGVTPKDSDDDCECQSTIFGCCLDGVTSATGPLFEGCDEIPRPQCSDAPITGPCHNYTAMWFYDIKYGGCSRFWYGGCDPGSNHYEDESSCQQACISPPGPHVCFLEKNAGSCSGIYNEWYFDFENKVCSPFVYSGCLGNGNRFLTRQDCQDMCTYQSDTPLCLKPKIEGGGNDSYPSWYFDQELNICLPFNYTGCNGNNNRFVTQESCQNACRHVVKQKRTEKICQLHISEGEGEDLQPRWGYDTFLQRCVPFFYRGSGGNENVFMSEADCQAVCPATFAPVIRLPRGDKVLAERGSPTTTLHITVRANPPATIEWFHNGRPLSRFEPRYTMSENFLQVSKVSDFDAGTYVVKALNGIKPTTENSNTASLQVIVYPLYPSVSITANKTLFKPGEDVVIPCTVTAYPFPRVEWYCVKYKSGRRQEIKVEEDEDTLIISQQTGVVTILNQLVLRNASQTQSGSYKCATISDYFETEFDIERISVHQGPSSSCVDRSTYYHCDKVVEHNYCGNKYYAQYCCLSCTQAGFAVATEKVR